MVKNNGLPSRTLKLHFTASEAKKAKTALNQLVDRYGQHEPDQADVIVCLGGDGFMIETMHEHIEACKPIYGMNRGAVGFLLNDFDYDNLPKRIKSSDLIEINPLKANVTMADNKVHTAYAINEASILRQSRQAVRLKISMNDKVELEEMVGDGILLSTPAGSTAYNLSADGPVLPLEANLLALTPLNAYRPRRWRGALIVNTTKVEIENLNLAKRPASCTVDHIDFHNIQKLEMELDTSISLPLLFDRGQSLQERLNKEQFMER